MRGLADMLRQAWCGRAVACSNQETGSADVLAFIHHVFTQQNSTTISMPFLTAETRYQLLKLLEHNPKLTQRELAEALGISLGKTNYCLNALIKKGWIKVRNFRQNKNKLGYAYFLTPKGFEEKTRVTLKFLEDKQAEYEVLVIELEELRHEAAMLVPADGRG